MLLQVSFAKVLIRIDDLLQGGFFEKELFSQSDETLICLVFELAGQQVETLADVDVSQDS